MLHLPPETSNEKRHVPASNRFPARDQWTCLAMTTIRKGVERSCDDCPVCINSTVVNEHLDHYCEQQNGDNPVTLRASFDADVDLTQEERLEAQQHSTCPFCGFTANLVCNCQLCNHNCSSKTFYPCDSHAQQRSQRLLRGREESRHRNRSRAQARTQFRRVPPNSHLAEALGSMDQRTIASFPPSTLDGEPRVYIGLAKSPFFFTHLTSLKFLFVRRARVYRAKLNSHY